MKISPARIAAFEILIRIERERAFSSALLPLYEQDLAENDRGLCHQLTLGVLRKQLYLDAVIARLAPGKKLDTEVVISLRLGLFQLFFLDKVPDYSAISESVNLVQYAKKTSAKGFVNAVLRRAAREEVRLTFSDEVEKVSIETSHPRWLVEKWIGEFGNESAAAIATANNVIPRQAFRLTPNGVKNGIAVPDDAVESLHVKGCFWVDRTDNELIELANAGDIYFQDEGSQLVGSVVDIPERGRFLDVCAAPGSKTSMTAERFGTGSRMLVAGDLHSSRVRILRENCCRQGVSDVAFVQYDAEKALPFADASFDTVLVDAPCSGTGTIRHNPEIRYSLEETDFAELHSKQLAILRNASNLVSLGGTLIYSTCSLEREENEAVVHDFLSSSDSFEVGWSTLPEAFRASNGFARTFPHRDNMDGFFIATLIRV